MNAASGAYGTYSWSYDLVGNRTVEAVTPSGGSLTTDTYAYPTTTNRIQTVTRGAATVRQMTGACPGEGRGRAGNLLTDNRAGTTTTYTYNKRNRLASATSGALVWGYTYGGLEQLAIRTLTTGGSFWWRLRGAGRKRRRSARGGQLRERESPRAAKISPTSFATSSATPAFAGAG